MKKTLLACILFFLAHQGFATHIIGGEMRYEYVGPGSAANSKQYRVRLLLLRGPTGATFINQYIVGIFNNDNNSKVLGPAENNNWAAVEDFSIPIAVPINISPCIQLAPNLNYTYKSYSFLVELPNNNLGYTVAFQTFSRQGSNNVVADQGANYLCVIPGNSTVPPPQTDNSPQFKLPVSVVCANSNFSLDFSATDPDPQDSLAYSFCIAYDGGPAPQADFRDPQPPPYQSVAYIAPFNALAPMGPLATINPVTGIISGIAPDAGKYVVCVCINVYRNGVIIATHRKDLIVEVSGCIQTQANAMPSFTTCDGFNIQFSHNSTGANSVFWDFGDPSTDADTSILDNPVYVYPDTGVYTIKFIINKGGNCTDSAFRTVAVYPGFFPGFEAIAPFCSGVPVQFNDTSLTSYGTVNSWSWNFGDGTVLSDTSHISNPSYSYPAPGTYTAQLIVTNSKGCIDTADTQVTILPSPVLTLLSQDTSYCRLDSLQLTATGTGNFSWTPNTNIIGANTATPTVFPSAATQYFVTLESQGCISRDSVLLTPVNDVSNAITANPAAICEEDSLTLTGNSNKTDHLQWQWSPAATVANPSAQTTRAWPAVTTTYTLTTTWGNHCVATASVNIPVTPLAIPQAGPDTSFCTGQSAIQLAASGGVSYSWSPAAGLSNTGIANPVANPTSTTAYVVSVGVNGCSKTRNDTVVVTVRQKPAFTLTNDTLICIIDTLQLNIAGPAGNIAWSPNYMINNTGSAAPLVSPDLPTMYYVRLTDLHGCFRDDSVFVDVKPQVTINAGPDTVICQSYSAQLHAAGDALHYNWTPPATLSNGTILNPVASPVTTTVYTITGTIGKCQAQSSVQVKVVPAPTANAGPDTTLCLGFDTQLHASGGSSYSWSPALFLSNAGIANPQVIQPPRSMQYIVTVTDTLGCPLPIKDTVLVNVIPLLTVNAGPRDTMIVLNQPLQLNATGALHYTWSPGTFLSNPNIANPIANPQDTMRYFLLGTDEHGCLGRDTINVYVFRVEEDMYVPTAFTPNGDGLNDIFKPILIGMKSLAYFKVYNRFGEMVYYTTKVNDGWNGIYKGKPQDTATFVWEAAGISFTGQLKKKKGYVVLIR
ncbi:MAG: PKD domain-containing protein [Ferruginibacter sp.]